MDFQLKFKISNSIAGLSAAPYVASVSTFSLDKETILLICFFVDRSDNPILFQTHTLKDIQ